MKILLPEEERGIQAWHEIPVQFGGCKCEVSVYDKFKQLSGLGIRWNFTSKSVAAGLLLQQACRLKMNLPPLIAHNEW